MLQLRSFARVFKACVRSRLFSHQGMRPGSVITDPYVGQPDLISSCTFLMVCGLGFNQTVPGAATCIRLGFVRGFQELGIKAVLVDVSDLERQLDRWPKPIVFLTVYDYPFLSRPVVRCLTRVNHFVWAYPWSDLFDRLAPKYTEVLGNSSLSPETIDKVLAGEPSFVWAPVGQRGVALYQEWDKHGLRFIQMHLACDPVQYYPETSTAEFQGIEMAFVGTYQAIKASAFEEFLRPYENRLTIYGANRWPFTGYQGSLPMDKERLLYHNARLCPTVNGEICYDFWDEVNERAFKVMGCKGLTITDILPAYRELFTADELMVPSTVDEYHDMVRQALVDDGLCEKYRLRAYEAIQSRHTYRHRALQILTELGVEYPTQPMIS